IEFNEIAAGIAPRIGAAHTCRAVQRLMDISYEMKQPGEIVRFEGIRAIGRKNMTEERDAVLNIRSGNGRQCGSIRGKRGVDEVPVLVHEYIVVAGVANGIGAAIGAIAFVAAVGGIGFVALDLVCPSSGNYENQ